VIGQDSVVKILRASVDKKHYVSAYLFSGLQGIGKTTLGRIFSNAILCDSPIDNNPCHKCESCKLFAKEQHFGYRELDAASFSGKEDMKQLRDEGAFLSVSDKKIILLDESHDISTAGQDALLKQIEQCPEHLIYMFCTTNPDKMAPTLRERCMELQLFSVEPSIIFDRLKYICEQENLNYQDDALVLISEKSKGHVRSALNMLEKISYLDEISVKNLNLIYKDFEEDIFEIVANLGIDLSKVLDTYHSISSYLSATQFYNLMLSLVNDAVKYLYGYDKFSEKYREFLRKLKEIHGSSLPEFLDYLIKRDKYIEKIGIQSDLVILHSKFEINSFAKQIPLNDIKIQNQSKKRAPNVKNLSFTELSKLDVNERSRILREQRMKHKAEQKEEKENVPLNWPLPKEKRLGENTGSRENLSAEEFSQNLVGGRVARVKPVVNP